MEQLKKAHRKKCSKCGLLKPWADYPPCKIGRHGLYQWCRKCHAAYQKSRYPNRQTIDEKAVRRSGLKKQGLKTCSSCKQVKGVATDFYGDPRRSDGKQSTCKECWTQKANASRLRKEYGLTPEEFRLLLDAQDGRCAICGRAPKKNKFNVDHCHKTHRIRSLLCVNCNTNLLPYVERFPEWVRRAFEYLENPPALKVLGERLVPSTNQARLGRKKKITLENFF